MRNACNWMIAMLGILLTAPTPVTAVEKLTIKQIIKKVQTSERLYKSIDMTFEYGLKTWMPKKPAAKAKPPAKNKIESSGSQGEGHLIEHKNRFAQNDQKFYFKSERIGSLDPDEEKIVRQTTTTIYDGKQTRTLSSVSGINRAAIRHARHLYTGMSLPNIRLFPGSSLSRLMQKPDAPTTNYRWRMLSGDERVDGLKCVKLQFEDVGSRNGVVSYRMVFWLAINRNYHPVKIVTYKPRFGGTMPTHISRITKFVQLKPGVWLPSKTVTAAYYRQKDGKRIQSWQSSFLLGKAKLNSKLDESLFKTLKFPKGTHVSELRDDGIRVKAYRQK